MDRKREVEEKEEFGETEPALGYGPFKHVVVMQVQLEVSGGQPGN